MSLPRQICEAQGLKLIKAQPLSGGDINQVFKLNTDQGPLVLKLNVAKRFPGMFAAEAHGLNTLAAAHCFRIPKVLHTGSLNDWSYLLMEYLVPANPGPDFWEHFGQQLAALHQNSRATFGLEQDNYIGSLPQSNTAETSLLEFYINQRLRPQVQLASAAGYGLASYEQMEARLAELLPEEPPALIHGDLWSGNYLVDEKGAPALIDPAVCYGPREMDLAMMQLFGGFPTRVWDSYREVYPLQAGWEERNQIWQLYYLLVHLNLFGAGYLRQVEGIIGRFS